jgi:hypothetical protein
MMKNYRMPLLGKTLASSVLMMTFLVAPSLIATSNNTSASNKYSDKTVVASTSVRVTDEAAAVVAEADAIYEDLSLDEKGLTKQAFEQAFQGYRSLLDKGMISKQNIISVADFSQSSRNKRLFIIDVEKHEVVTQTYVAHGRNSGQEYATSFSNTPESHQSSLGFYLTKNTYIGQHGLSLVLDGIEKGINDNAEARKIVIHGANYIGDSHLKSNPFTGRSHGCPAVASKLSKSIIETIKDGSVLFIYHPSASYLKRSRILNG